MLYQPVMIEIHANMPPPSPSLKIDKTTHHERLHGANLQARRYRNQLAHSFPSWRRQLSASCDGNFTAAALARSNMPNFLRVLQTKRGQILQPLITTK